MSERENDKTTEEPRQDEETRREALAKMGRLAGYTAPAMMVLLGVTKARAVMNGTTKPN